MAKKKAGSRILSALLALLLVSATLLLPAAADEGRTGRSTAAYGFSGPTIGVSTHGQLQDAVDAASEKTAIILSGDIQLEETIYIDSGKDLLFVSENGTAALKASTGDRHFLIRNAGEVTLAFDAVVLDGEQQGGGIRAENTDLILDGASIVNCTRDSSGAALHFMGSSSNSLYIKNTVFDGNTAPGNDGGAMLIQDADKVVFDKDTAINNSYALYYAGAIYIERTNRIEIAASFTGNKVEYDMGGALFINYCGDVIIDGASFTSNTAGGAGGAIVAQNSQTLKIVNSSFADNKAYGDRSGGGAVYASAIGETIQIESSNFEKNFAQYSGSAVFLLHNPDATILLKDGLYEDNRTNTNGTVSIENGAKKITISGGEYIKNNAAINAGGINLAFSTLDVEIQGVTVKENTAGERGGGIVYETAYNGTIYIRDSFVLDNKALDEHGGGIFLNIYHYDSDIPNAGKTFISNTVISGNKAGSEGGGIRLCNSTVEITDSSITGNFARYGGGISLEKYSQERVFIGGATRITNNSADMNGGGIYIPEERVAGATIGEDVVFSGNRARTFALTLKEADEESNDEETHRNQILTKHFSTIPGIDMMFDYAYNNYDINYTRDINPEGALRVSYVGNGGIIRESGSERYAVVVYVDQERSRYLDEPTVEKDDVDFLGWYLDDVDGRQWNFAVDQVEEDMTLYAHWKEDEETGGETPGGETPGGETPGGETPGGETPGGETPGGETPGGETPGGETPGGETPGGETPGGETPGGNGNSGGSSGGRDRDKSVKTGRDVYINDLDVPLAQELLSIFEEEVPLEEISLFDIPDTGIQPYVLVVMAAAFAGSTLSLMALPRALRKED